uniref:F-box domain-containing protein n=1 Tax=Laticauda laticaudata TaxID=8630 RepID=A0A8C5WZ44_LATLA
MDTCRLPVEVIAYILSFLPISDRKEASLVNRTWYFAAQDSLRQDSTVLSLAEALSKNLRVLDLSSCVSLSNRSIQAIASSLLLLTVLRLAWCKELTDWGLLGIEEPREECECAKEKDAGPKFSRNFGNMGFFLPPPQDLERDKMAVINLNQQKAQEQRQTSLNTLTRLQELDLTACGKLTDISIAKVISFPDLRYLSLSLVPNITDTSLLAIARNCRSLEHLSLSHCTSLTDRGFAEAAGSLCRLQHLILSGCNQLTPRGNLDLHLLFKSALLTDTPKHPSTVWTQRDIPVTSSCKQGEKATISDSIHLI